MFITHPKSRKILSLSIPAALNALLDMLQVLADLIMVGRLGAAAVAAVGLGLQFWMFIYSILTLFHVGTNALISRFIGAKTPKRASVALSTLLMFGAFVSLPLTLLWYLATPYFLQFIGALDEVMVEGMIYMEIVALALPIAVLKMIFVSGLNATGDTKTPFKVKLFSIGLNVFLNYLLIFGNHGFPALGVAGAAYATVIVNYLEFGIYGWLYLREKTHFNPMLRFSNRLLKRALKVGLPASIERSLTMGSFMLFTAVIGSFGTAAIAGYQIGLRVEGLAFMPGIGFTIAAMTLIGQNIGAKDYEGAKEDVVLILKYASALMGFLGLFMIAIPEQIVWVFTDDEATIEQASLYLRIVGFSQIPLAFSFVLSGALRGAGATKRTMRINLISLWSFRIIPALVLAYTFESILLVYLAMITETSIKGFWLWREFKKGEWMHLKV